MKPEYEAKLNEIMPGSWCVMFDFWNHKNGDRYNTDSKWGIWCSTTQRRWQGKTLDEAMEKLLSGQEGLK